MRESKAKRPKPNCRPTLFAGGQICNFLYVTFLTRTSRPAARGPLAAVEQTVRDDSRHALFGRISSMKLYIVYQKQTSCGIDGLGDMERGQTVLTERVISPRLHKSA
ncbi:hypothetical protein EVAR_31553_1 [Eumeta japonica]|uniref:Uncharacterized protein n=1 Tax=Eumeta variegata TaxID=151549 RepID=A0A4C1V9U9_EUMVA|nr:hypothetical protein EVAR_31553_1 [Eumeta japonica]